MKSHRMSELDFLNRRHESLRSCSRLLWGSGTLGRSDGVDGSEREIAKHCRMMATHGS